MARAMSARQRAALRKAQMASARKRRGTGKKPKAIKKYSKRRGAYARKADKMSRSKKRSHRAAAYVTRGSGGKDSSLLYKASKRRGKKAGKAKRYSKKRGSYSRTVDKMASSKHGIVRGVAWTTRGNGTKKGLTRASSTYLKSKKRSPQAGKYKRKRR